ncbi:MAG: YcjX family protein [Bauldia litoralis]|uniref:YcjX family protein n=1 Tax=Bauldia litoralis TaxID=665467 RepID=UPI0032986118
MPLTTITDETRLALATLADRTIGITSPSIRLGVTGLARAGKTVFISALVHNLVHGGRLPLFRAYSGGRVLGARLEPQPDDAVPRFDYESHVAALVDERIWPDSTRQISELRLTIQYESASLFSRTLGRGRMHVDIVDYPGEWLLDLPLLSKDFPTWSREALDFARTPERRAAAAAWLAALEAVDPKAPEDETQARNLARTFTDYLRATRAESGSLSTLPPGRFLMPGDLDGSPALTFSPLDLADDDIPAGSVAAMMARRYESYKTAVIRPFFRDHFARLDRQIVLIDALEALSAGSTAVAGLETALAEILAAFRLGRANWLSALVSRRIDRILFAATKADHLHHGDHDRLEAILSRIVGRAIDRARFAGATVDVIALASARATREGTVTDRGQRLPTIIGTPLPGETVNGRVFDGSTEIAMFPGDLPDDPESVFEDSGHLSMPLQYVRFRPPRLERTAEGLTLSLPHIRLDRALEFLIGDRLG